jgi:branched-chain amino acid transport system permease protein
VLLPEWLRFTQGFYLMGYAVLVMVMMAFSPSGLLGLADRLTRPAPRTGTGPVAESPEAAARSEGAG